MLLLDFQVCFYQTWKFAYKISSSSLYLTWTWVSSWTLIIQAWLENLKLNFSSQIEQGPPTGGSGAAGGSTCIKKNIFIVIIFKKKDIILYLAAPEPPDVAPVMPWVAGPWNRTQESQVQVNFYRQNLRFQVRAHDFIHKLGLK